MKDLVLDPSQFYDIILLYFAPLVVIKVLHNNPQTSIFLIAVIRISQHDFGFAVIIAVGARFM